MTKRVIGKIHRKREDVIRTKVAAGEGSLTMLSICSRVTGRLEGMLQA